VTAGALEMSCGGGWPLPGICVAAAAASPLAGGGEGGLGHVVWTVG
jgi:hypothetical protein